jgi:tRNA1(Val) A37 N6-methylase TrmN6
MDYSQPDFYRFSQDSLLLVNKALEEMPDAKRVLDLGCGCGVIGIELANKLDHIEKLDLIEYQADFLSYIELNLENLLHKTIPTQLYQNSFYEFKSSTQYDLIVGNLPYFMPHQSRPSPDKRKNTCRQWEVGSVKDVVRILDSNLTSDGKSLLIINDELLHELDTYQWVTLEKLKNVTLISVNKVK